SARGWRRPRWDAELLGGAREWNEAHAAFVRDDQIARLHLDAGDAHRLVHADRFNAPFAGDRAYAGRPDRIADGARVVDVAHRAVDDRGDLALPFSNRGR